MKLLLKIVLCFQLTISNLALYENPFQLQQLFGTMFKIDRKIQHLREVDIKFIEKIHEKVFAFHQEIEDTPDFNKYEKEDLIMNRVSGAKRT